VSGLRRDVVILACAVSAGIHGALAPAHFAEGAGAGVGFVASSILLAGLAVGLTVRPASSVPLAGAALVFAGVLGSYALATTTGLPLLHPQPEPVDGLALATKAFEAVGLVTALNLLWRRLAVSPTPQPKRTTDMSNAGSTRSGASRPIPLALTLLVAFFAALAALAVSNGHDAMAHGSAPEHAEAALAPAHSPAAVTTRHAFR
jgi:hypothetical protein